MTPSNLQNWLKSYQQTLSLPENRPLIMGILNVTPNSFSDGGLYLESEKAYERALTMIEEGADIIDIGGCSTKPGAPTIPIETELERVLPVIKKLARTTDTCLSIDTYQPKVMQKAVEQGASFINDIHALTLPGALDSAAQLKVPICLMHMQGIPLTMQNSPFYPQGVIKEIDLFFQQRIEACVTAGINKNQLILDPGFGFGKTINDNLTLLNHLKTWHKFQLPILLAVSRKSTIGALLNASVAQRLAGSLAIAVFAALEGTSIIRTHDVKETQQALTIIQHIKTNMLNERGMHES